jgi:hypothetical protein
MAQSNSATVPRADFKGARLGMTLEEWKQLNEGALAKSHPCSKAQGESRLIGDVFCTGRRVETVASAPVLRSEYAFMQDELVTIELGFDSDDFSRIALSLQERYGSPKSIEEPVMQTNSGATFKNDVRIWNVGADTIRLEKYTGRITAGSLLYESPKFAPEYRARTKSLAKEGKKDL